MEDVEEDGEGGGVEEDGREEEEVFRCSMSTIV